MYPSYMVIACNHDDISKYNKIFNTNDIEYYLWIKLPDNLPSSYRIFDMNEVDSKCNTCIDMMYINHTAPSKMISVVSNVLNNSTGMHIYKLHVVDTVTENLHPLYISYTIQNDNVDKPYIYVNRECTCRRG